MEPWCEETQSGSPPWLVGRDAELSVLRELLAATGPGYGQSVLVRGEAGIGKTSLLEAFAAECDRTGVRVVRSGQAGLSDRGRGDGELFDVLASLPGSPVRAGRDLSAAEHVADVWGRRGDGGPIVLLLDNLNRTGDSDIAALSRVQLALEQLPLLVCAAVEPAEGNSPLSGGMRLPGVHGTQVLPVPPLAAHDVAALASRLLRATPGPRLLERLSAAGGNPLYVTAMLSALAQDGSLRATGNRAEVDIAAGDVPGETPCAVGNVVMRRLDALPGPTKEVLGMAALLGSRVDLWDLALVTDRPVMAVWESLAAAVETGLLEDAEDSLSFRHDLVRQTLAAAVAPSDRAAFHHRAGQVMAAAGALPEKVAEQLMHSVGPLDHPSLQWVADQAHVLGLRAPATAAQLLERALEAVPASDLLASVFRKELAEVLLRLEEPHRAAELAREALASGHLPANAAGLHLLLVRSAYLRRDYGQAITEAHAALNRSPGDARFEAFTAQCHFMVGRFGEAESAARRAVTAGERGDTDAAVHGLVVQAWNRLAALHADEALEFADRAVALLGNKRTGPELPASPYLARGLALVELDRFEEAHQAFDRALPDASSCGLLGWYHSGKARLGYLEGRWDDALAEVGAGLESAGGFGMSEALNSQAALIGVHRGTTQMHGDISGRTDDGIGTCSSALVRSWAQALAWEAQGDRVEALAMLCDTWQTSVPGAGRRVLNGLCIDAVRLAAGVGDVGRLRALTEMLAIEAAGTVQIGVHGAALFGQGLLEGDAGVLLAAADAFRSVGQVLHEAYAFEGAALVLGRRAEAGPARRALCRAVELYGRLGAVTDATRAEDTLAALGVRIRRPARNQPRTGWEALTATELKIVEYAAQGCSNPDIGARMFLSPRTVQFHLSAIFTKLGTGSRVELAVQAHLQSSGAGSTHG